MGKISKIFLILILYLFCNQSIFAKTLTCAKAEKEDKPIVVLYSADYCIYCNKFKPVFYHLADNLSDKYSFAYYDVTKKNKKSICDNVELTGLPTLYVMDIKRNKKFLISEKFYSNTTELKTRLNLYYKNLK